METIQEISKEDVVIDVVPEEDVKEYLEQEKKKLEQEKQEENKDNVNREQEESE